LAAASLLGGARDVGVVGLQVEGVLLQVVEGAVLHATIAAEVAVSEAGAVDELLLGEFLERAGGEEVSTLFGEGGRESPAGTALSLVLDGVDGALGDPVDGGLVTGDLVNVVVTVGHLTGVTKHGLVLGVGPVRELVVAGNP